MTVLEAAVLGIVQGLTEFVPISSSAHLVLVPAIMGWETPPVAFVVLLHAGTLVGVIIYFARDLARLIQGLFRPGAQRQLAGYLAIGTLPAGAVGVAFEEQISRIFDHPRLTAALLIGTAAVLFISELRVRREKPKSDQSADVSALAHSLNPAKSFAVGVAQAIAILPGLSRSGLTIGAGLTVHLTRIQAARFSFLLSIPILAGTSIFEILDIAALDVGMNVLLTGFVVSLISGFVAVSAMIGYLQRRGLYPFAAYCCVVGIVLVFLLPS